MANETGDPRLNKFYEETTLSKAQRREFIDLLGAMRSDGVELRKRIAQCRRIKEVYDSFGSAALENLADADYLPALGSGNAGIQPLTILEIKDYITNVIEPTIAMASEVGTAIKLGGTTPINAG